MGGLLEVLTEEAEVQREKILADAKAKSRKILTDAEAMVADLKKKSFQDCDEKLRLERERLLGNAHLQSRNLVIQAKHDVLEEAFRRALATLVELRNQPEYAEIFHCLANETLGEFEGAGNNKVFVFVDARDLRLCRDFFDNKGIPYEIDTSKTFIGGLEIASSDTRFKVSNTLEGRLAKKKNGLLGRLAKILFEH
jgi:vacuolar-type H+-ATPase subunit E/Vma4